MQHGPQLACSERFERTQPPSEFASRQTAVAVEVAKKIFCHGFAFLGVAFHAGGNAVAAGIGPPAGKGHDMVETAHAGGEPAQTAPYPKFAFNHCYAGTRCADPSAAD
jgi:hypothetical protein